MKDLSPHALAIRPSPTLSLNAMLKARAEAGERVLNLCVGEPDFPMPELAARMAIQAIEDGESRYTDVAGTPGLRERIRRKLSEENDLDYGADQIVASTGAKQALYNAFFVLCGEGDEVVVPAPYWVTYPEQVRAVGATPVIATAGRGSEYKLTAGLLEQHVTSRTKAVVLNNPGNPTGTTYTRDELAAIAEVVLRHDLYVVEDLIYEHFHYGEGKVESIAAIGTPVKDRTIVINGVSKSCGMTGWRVGYSAAPARISALMKRLQSQSTSNVTAVAQRAAIGALDDVPWTALAGYRDRSESAYRQLAAIDGVDCPPPTGAFYLFPDISRFLGDGGPATSDEFCTLLLERTGVGIVPGTVFGSPGNVRISYAAAPEVVAEGLELLQKFVVNL